MSIPQIVGILVSGLQAVAATLLTAAALAFAVLVVFLVKQPEQRVFDEAPEPYIRSRIEHETAGAGAGTPREV